MRFSLSSVSSLGAGRRNNSSHAGPIGALPSANAQNTTNPVHKTPSVSSYMRLDKSWSAIVLIRYLHKRQRPCHMAQIESKTYSWALQTQRAVSTLVQVAHSNTLQAKDHFRAACSKLAATHLRLSGCSSHALMSVRMISLGKRCWCTKLLSTLVTASCVKMSFIFRQAVTAAPSCFSVTCTFAAKSAAMKTSGACHNSHSCKTSTMHSDFASKSHFCASQHANNTVA